MSQKPVAIPKHPALKPAADYYLLRREGIGFIEQMGSSHWTDYNLHDPGITILEALCYAITDLGYRLGWDIKDLLMPADPATDTRQPFFTARSILTVNPWTTDDFRRLLIDLDGVRNAWLFCKDCACDLHWYAWCEDDQLHLNYLQPPPSDPFIRRRAPEKVSPRGMYEVLLELEAGPESGDLNDRKIEKTFMLENNGEYFPVTLELRFPNWSLLNDDDYRYFLESNDAINAVAMEKIVRDKTDETSIVNDVAGNTELRRYVRGVFYTSLKATFAGGREILFKNAALRLFCSDTATKNLTIDKLEDVLEDKFSTGFIWQYRNKLRKIQKAVDDAKISLLAHRNLDEDYCTVQRVGAEDVAVCCDVEVAPDADIERVQARIWFEIEQYFNPPVLFYSLQELLDEGVAVEEIFQGPALDNGFIKADELKAAGLKAELRVSDILNRLMDIEGVVTVNNLMLTKYDAEGHPVKGAADLHALVPNPEKISAQWTLAVTPLHQPRLYYNLSRFLFYKNGLPFLPRTDEARDTLIQLRGESERPKIKTAANDLPVPQGRFRDPENYFPVQYSFPLTYGIGYEGLPANASPLRRARAKQLKAYLMPFEQILVNALAQVTHTADLFSLDPAVQRSYFIRLLDESLIKGANDIFSPLDAAQLNDLIESETEFLERRNRFLDHLLARFGEQFKEYALLLTNLEGQRVALEELVTDKIAFLKAYPVISRDRARAFNYTYQHPRDFSNVPGLQRRIGKLLGHQELMFFWDIQKDTFSGQFTVNFTLRDELEMNVFTGTFQLAAAPLGQTEAAYLGKAKYDMSQVVISRLQKDIAYAISPESGKSKITLKDADGFVLAVFVRRFDKAAAAQDHINNVLTRLWSEEQRMVVVEHLLLRPKFPGDALWPACSDGPCKTCNDEDPYSFRLTFVMPGWTAPYNTNLDMRRFAEQVIRRETPSHLLPKICWVSNSGYLSDECDPILDDLKDILERIPGYEPGTDCTCAIDLFGRFATIFNTIYEPNKYKYLPFKVWQDKIKTAFAGVSFSALPCLPGVPDAAIQDEIGAIMLDYFAMVAVYGAQFSRFDKAWTAWLEANIKFDWTEERLHERVEAMLEAGLKEGAKKPAPGELCRCAGEVLEQYGFAFHEWMSAKMESEIEIPASADLGPVPQVVLPACVDGRFYDETKTDIKAMLETRYEGYKEVSFRLWILVHLMADLDNTYPAATLHDCDDGSDANPVRLGQTGLGAFRMKPEPLPVPARPGLSKKTLVQPVVKPVPVPKTKTGITLPGKLTKPKLTPKTPAAPKKTASKPPDPKQTSKKPGKKKPPE